jgi:hypothetical protein
MDEAKDHLLVLRIQQTISLFTLPIGLVKRMDDLIDPLKVPFKNSDELKDKLLILTTQGPIGLFFLFMALLKKRDQGREEGIGHNMAVF